MKPVISAWILLVLIFAQAPLLAEEKATTPPQSLIVVVGAGGTPQFEISFYQWSERWEAAAKQAGIPATIIGRHRGEGKIEVADYDRLRDQLPFCKQAFEEVYEKVSSKGRVSPVEMRKLISQRSTLTNA